MTGTPYRGRRDRGEERRKALRRRRCLSDLRAQASQTFHRVVRGGSARDVGPLHEPRGMLVRISELLSAPRRRHGAVDHTRRRRMRRALHRVLIPTRVRPLPRNRRNGGGRRALHGSCRLRERRHGHVRGRLSRRKGLRMRELLAAERDGRAGDRPSSYGRRRRRRAARGLTRAAHRVGHSRSEDAKSTVRSLGKRGSSTMVPTSSRRRRPPFATSRPPLGACRDHVTPSHAPHRR